MVFLGAMALAYGLKVAFGAIQKAVQIKEVQTLTEKLESAPEELKNGVYVKNALFVPGQIKQLHECPNGCFRKVTEAWHRADAVGPVSDAIGWTSTCTVCGCRQSSHLVKTAA